MALTETQKREVEILRAQGETDERIAKYLGVPVPKAKATAKPKDEKPTEPTEPTEPAEPADLA